MFNPSVNFPEEQSGRSAAGKVADLNLKVMKKTSKNKLAMYKSVRTVLDQYSSTWNQLGAMPPLVASFEAKVAQFEQLAYTQAFATQGASDEKRQALSEAIQQAVVMASALKAYAIVSNNPSLLALVRITRSEFRRGGILGTFQRIDLVLEKATEHLNDLGIYGVDQSSIDALQEVRNSLSVYSDKPRNAQIQRRVITLELYALQREIDWMLRDQIDALMSVLRTNAPGFYNAYTSARMIVETHHATGKMAPPEPDDGGTQE
jgi:hypothetical protein